MGRIKNKLKYEIERARVRFNSVVQCVMAAPDVKSIDETLDTILARRASISRFGDGEFDIIFGRYETFQSYNPLLRSRLRQVLKANNESDRFLVGIPNCYGDLSHFIPEAQNHWRIRLEKERYKWYKILNRKYPYYQSQISRFYHDWVDKGKSYDWAEKLKKIWKQRDVLIVEGEKSRMGVGNDLFDLCLSVRRILCPAVNAFEKYETILTHILKYAAKDDLILMGLGPTASILAYDLYKEGYQAIDLGHVDLEYEWMKMHAIDKVRIPGRFMNELDGGQFVDNNITDKRYAEQIIDYIK